MTREEKKKFGDLAVKIDELAAIVNKDYRIDFTAFLRLKEPASALDYLSTYLDGLRLYLLYMRFDHEASVRDMENLLSILDQMGGRG